MPAVEGSAPSGQGPRRPSWSVLLVLLAAALPLLPTLRAGFVYDDQVLVVDLHLTDDPGLVQTLTGDLFGVGDDGGPASGYYRPLIRLTYRLEAWLWGDLAFGWHLDNLLLHVAVCLALLAFLRRVPFLAPLALPAVLLFAAHPVHAESLAPISGRTDPLTTLLVLLALQGAVRGRVLLPLAGFAAALCAKESAAIWAPVLALAPFAGVVAPARRRAAGGALLAGTLVLTAAFFWLKLGLLEIRTPPSAFTGEGNLASRVTTFVSLVPRYLGLLAWPAHLSIVHDVRLAQGITDPRLWLGTVTVVLLVVFAGVGPRAVRVGAGILLWTLLPASNVVPITYAFREVPFPFFERYLFAPSLGFVVLVAWVLHRVAAAAGRRNAATAVALAALLALPLGVRLFVRVLEFQSDVTLFRAAVAAAPDDDFLRIHLAWALLREGNTPAGLAAFDALLAEDPQNLAAAVGKANALATLAQTHLAAADEHAAAGLEDEAEHLQERARALLGESRRLVAPFLRADDAGLGGVLEVLGTIAGMLGNPLDAAALYRRAWAAGGASPALGANYRKIARDLLRRSRELGSGKGTDALQDAIRHTEAAARALTGAMPPATIPPVVRDPVLTLLADRGDNLVLLGQADAAGAAYQRLLELEPAMFRAHEALGYLAKQRGDRQEAYDRFRSALQINPDAFYALNEMVTMLKEDGRDQEAYAYFRRLQRMLGEAVDRRPRREDGLPPAGPPGGADDH